MAESFLSKSSGSLCLQITFSALECRIPSIILAWFAASDRITAFGKRAPKVLNAAQLDTYPEVNKSAASL